MKQTTEKQQQAHNITSEAQGSQIDIAQWGPTIKGEGMASQSKRFSPQVAGDAGSGNIGMATQKKNWRAKW